MKPVNFPQANRTLTRPEDMTEDQCESLHVYTDGNDCISCWEMSIIDRIRALLFGRVWLFVHSGRTQPPVALLVQPQLFEEVVSRE